MINNLKNQLLKGLPGPEVQFRMAPVSRRSVVTDEQALNNYRLSAVMILFCRNDKNEWFIPLTQRMTYEGAHSGQISLPGGKFETKDVDLKNTALRECEEEIGIGNVEIIGDLTPLLVPVSGFKIQPFIGFCPVENPVFTEQQREVNKILHFPVMDLLNDTVVKEGRVEVQNNLSLLVPYFDVEGNKVWGATAMILSELKELIKLSAS